MSLIAEQIAPIFDKRLPAALVAALLLQMAGALFWAGSAAERISVLERDAATNRTAIERVAVLEDQVTTIKQSLDRIETKLDQLQTHQH